ncbi:DMT family transporter [Effusibacillus lacus]|uniref:Cysteine transporter n=1 Tax=Effusibacillus lacus TaxID=1348429 RepID=A0A292YJ53_9BACL|nr:DMT family transporter [Effusibacillus lacus]TCS75476.1 drug/metabolite transporter (DMT)-like permease [Effusibacillus lacus]GAX88941.1 cysteine transporter [Effusibacillus lacus]
MGKYKAWILLVFCNLFWAGNYIFGKYVIAEMSPLWITFSRWVLSLGMLFPIAHFLEKPNWRHAGKEWPTLVAMGILGVIGYNLLLYSALAFTSPTNAALVSALNPGVIVLFSVFLLRERISLPQAGGFVVSLIGVLVILTKGNLGQLFHTEYNQGDLLMIGAVIVWTLYSIIGKRIAGVPPITATAISTFYSTLIMAPFAFIQGIDTGSISMVAVTGILYMTIFPSVGSFVFWNMSVRAIGASQAGIFLNLIPVFTALISLMLGETITASQVWGGLLVFAGVYLTTGMLERMWANRSNQQQRIPR